MNYISSNQTSKLCHLCFWLSEKEEVILTILHHGPLSSTIQPRLCISCPISNKIPISKKQRTCLRNTWKFGGRSHTKASTEIPPHKLVVPLRPPKSRLAVKEQRSPAQPCITASAPSIALCAAVFANLKTLSPKLAYHSQHDTK